MSASTVTTTRPKRRRSAAFVLRRVKQELRMQIRSLERDTSYQRDDRTKGHLEAMRHIKTVIDVAEKI